MGKINRGIGAMDARRVLVENVEKISGSLVPWKLIHSKLGHMSKRT